jgi:glycosyltransferase involved in cell wall biosynthesis
MNTNHLRVAWLFPSLVLGNYWHPVLAEFSKIYSRTAIYTGAWPGFSSGFEDTFTVKVVGEMEFVDTIKSETGYSEGFIKVSPAIVGELLKFRPHIIFTSGFCLWTIFALVFKWIAGWQVVIVYDGSSPGVDYQNSRLRTLMRRILTRFTDAFITNSQAGKRYLMRCLGVNEQSIFARPYQVPNAEALLTQSQAIDPDASTFQRPIFLFTGQVVSRKGLHQLLEACVLLQNQGYRNYTLLVAGDGEQREELQAFCQIQDLEDCVRWLGWVNYGELGAYFQTADVFILPTLEDVWGMVVLEAMAFGKPVLCSKWAGASEMLTEGENGYLFDSYNPEEIATAMRRFLDEPTEMQRMGQRSQALIAPHNPIAAAQFLAKVTDTLVGGLM